MSILDVGFGIPSTLDVPNDIFSTGSFEPVESVGFTDAVLSTVPSRSGGTQNLLSEATGFVKGLFGFASAGGDLLNNLDLQSRQLTGDGFLPDDRQVRFNEFAAQGQFPLGPVLLVAVGIAAVMLLRR